MDSSTLRTQGGLDHLRWLQHLASRARKRVAAHRRSEVCWFGCRTRNGARPEAVVVLKPGAGGIRRLLRAHVSASAPFRRSRPSRWSTSSQVRVGKCCAARCASAIGPAQRASGRRVTHAAPSDPRAVSRTSRRARSCERRTASSRRRRESRRPSPATYRHRSGRPCQHAASLRLSGPAGARPAARSRSISAGDRVVKPPIIESTACAAPEDVPVLDRRLQDRRWRPDSREASIR